uniref:HECT-type E3 ubiquitin transferase n=1 Tax=Macrostomum lignano TaxID=282301 RepID=A0A1I8INF1_9PLAT
GLENAGKLVPHLCRYGRRVEDCLLSSLTDGLRHLAGQLERRLSRLADELQDHLAKAQQQQQQLSASASGSSASLQQLETATASSSSSGVGRVLQDRFSGANVVLRADALSGYAPPRDLALPSLAALANDRHLQRRLLKLLNMLGQLDSQGGRAAEVSQVLEPLWARLSECLSLLNQCEDPNSVLVLQTTVESFFVASGGSRDQAATLRRLASAGAETNNSEQLSHLDLEISAPDTAAPAAPSASATSTTPKELAADSQKAFLLSFATRHRGLLNQILRQQTTPLTRGPFAWLAEHPRLLDFDVKVQYFRSQLDSGRPRNTETVAVNRQRVFEDSFAKLHRKSRNEWKQHFQIHFQGEEGQDAGGLLREWYAILSREIFNPNYALFKVNPGDQVTYTINAASHINNNHLTYFKFVGRLISKAVYDNKLLECYFTRAFYKHILGLPVNCSDLESEDYDFYKGLRFLLENDVASLGYEQTFSTEVSVFGVTETRELVPDGRNKVVTEDNKAEYVARVCQERMIGSIRQQLAAFLEGFYDIIPKRLISIFNEQELELLISGLPTIDIDDLRANTLYEKYSATSPQIQWLWRALRSFDQADRARFIQFVTGTSKVPLGGFAKLEGMRGQQKFQVHRDGRSTDRLPTAHTCFNQLDLPVYESYEKLREMLLLAITECSEGYGLA